MVVAINSKLPSLEAALSRVGHACLWKLHCTWKQEWSQDTGYLSLLLPQTVLEWILFPPQGRAGIQSPTTTNYAAEFPTFGKIEGVSISGVQKISLTLGKLSL